MSDEAWRAFCEFVKHPYPDRLDREPWEIHTAPRKAKPIRKRKVTLARAMKQASKAGVSISGATVKPEGSVALELGHAPNGSTGSTSNDGDFNEWDEVLQ
jgi:hypothetical protein